MHFPPFVTPQSVDRVCLNYFKCKTCSHYQQQPVLVVCTSSRRVTIFPHLYPLPSWTLLYSSSSSGSRCPTSPIYQPLVLMDCLHPQTSKNMNRTSCLLCSPTKPRCLEQVGQTQEQLFQRSCSQLQYLFCHSNTVNKWKLGWSFFSR